MHEPQDGFSYAGCTPEEAGLYREVRQLMAEAPEDQQELSSDEEGYVDRLMSGRISRRNTAASARGDESGAGPLAARRDSVPASSPSQFQGRLDSIFGGLTAGGPLAVQPDLLGRIGPAFSGQSKGLPLEEPKEAAPLDDSDDELDGAGAAATAGVGDGDGDGDGDGPDDEDDEDMFAHDDVDGEQREDGAEEDVREWSRHTATWAHDGGSSDDEADAMQTDKAAAPTAAPTAAPAAPASDGFGGMDDLQDLDDDGAGDGEAATPAAPASSGPTSKRAGGVAAADGASGSTSAAGGSGGSGGGGGGGASPSGKRSRCAQAAPPSRPGVASSDDPFLASLLGKKPPAAAAAAPSAAAHRLRTGYTLYSLDDQPDTEATNQQALAAVLRMTGAGAAADGAVAARQAPAAPSRAMGTGGRLMAEVSVGASKPRTQKKAAGRKQPAVAGGMPPPPAKAPRVKSMAMAAEDGDDEMVD